MAGGSEKKRVYEEIVSTIMDQIKDGTLRPGSKLPSERQLADKYHASRTAVREALHTLSSLGYIESRVGDGTFVREVTLDNLLRPFSDVLSRDRKLIRDVLDVRIILESESARLAAANASEQNCRNMLRSNMAMQKEVDKGKSGVEKDAQFHQELAASSGNGAIMQILTMCEDLLSTSARYSLNRPGRAQEAVDDHRKIVDAILRHDPDAAMLEMKQHLEKGYEVVNGEN